MTASMPTPQPSTPTPQPGAVFPDAVSQQLPLLDESALGRAEMAQWRAAYPSWNVALLVLPVLGAIVGLLAGGLVGLLIGLVVFALPYGAVWLKQRSDADRSFWDQYYATRGLQPLGVNLAVDGATPLLRHGNERRYDRLFAGRVGPAQMQVGLYTYVVYVQERDANGYVTTRKQNHPYTVVRAELPPQVAARYPGVYCRQHGFSLGHLQDAVMSDRAVQLESAEFAKHYSLRVADQQDNLALFELFDPSFVDWLTAHFVQWEQQGPAILFYAPKHATTSTTVDALCAGAASVYGRYMTHWR